MKKEEIKAILFDIGGVLALPKKPIKNKKGDIVSGVHSYVAQKLGISIDQWFDSIDSVYSKSIEGKISDKKVLEIISGNNKTSAEKIEKLIVEAYKLKMKQNKQLLNKAFKLKKLGYKIAVLSDQWPLSKRALIPDNLYRNFNKLIVSCDVGLRKPNPKIYKLSLKKLKMKPSEVLFIDNQRWNIKPAKKLGIKTILFKNNPQLFKEPKWRRLFEK